MDDAAATDPVFVSLRRLDELLERAVRVAQGVYGSEAWDDPFRGLHIGEDEPERLLSREPGAPLFSSVGEPEPSRGAGAGSRLAWLGEAFRLSPFDLDVILLALAPEIDLRYERLYAYLQDDVTRRRPTVDLALNLLCATPGERIKRRSHFTPAGPLLAGELVHLVAEHTPQEPTLLARAIQLDDQVTRLLLGQPGLDQRLASFCRLVAASEDAVPALLAPETRQALSSALTEARKELLPLRLYFRGPRGSGKRRGALALARDAQAPLLLVDLPRAPLGDELEETIRRVLREALFASAVVYLSGVDAIPNEPDRRERDRMIAQLAGYPTPIILSGVLPTLAAGWWRSNVVDVTFDVPDVLSRRRAWRLATTSFGLDVGEEELDAVAGRFRLTPGQIASAAESVYLRTTGGGAGVGEAPEQTDVAAELFAGARGQSAPELSTLAYRIDPAYGWDDIVLPPEAVDQLREICWRVNRHYRVLGEWGFGRKLSRGKGSTALFAGPSGTGKTMAAEIIANELHLDLYRIDLSGVVSKYIGETEKNLDRIFTAAEAANAILLFDEADALFGKRSEVRDAHDRYANIEISYLLQKMELYEGVAILATNLRQNLDEAFVRRLAFTVHFPFPDAASRRQIWERIWPEETPREGNLDLDYLATEFKLSGGNIKNVALAATFLAAEEGPPVTMGHVLRGVRREFQKMGKAISPDSPVAPAGVAVEGGGGP